MIEINTSSDALANARQRAYQSQNLCQRFKPMLKPKPKAKAHAKGALSTRLPNPGCPGTLVGPPELSDIAVPGRLHTRIPVEYVRSHLFLTQRVQALRMREEMSLITELAAPTFQSNLFPSAFFFIVFISVPTKLSRGIGFSFCG